ncbi:MAG: heavy-metal-associated domain-containing protein [Leadbetterella sp.]
MKNVIFGFMVVLLFSQVSFGQNNVQTVTFKTSAKCGMCKMRLERDMSLAKGVKEATLNLDDKKMTLVYNPKKTNPNKLKRAISKIGYDAEEVTANQKAHDALPHCCRKSAVAHND